MRRLGCCESRSKGEMTASSLERPAKISTGYRLDLAPGQDYLFIQYIYKRIKVPMTESFAL